jgi:hypothetical protein
MVRLFGQAPLFPRRAFKLALQLPSEEVATARLHVIEWARLHRVVGLAPHQGWPIVGMTASFGAYHFEETNKQTGHKAFCQLRPTPTLEERVGHGQKPQATPFGPFCSAPMANPRQ